MSPPEARESAQHLSSDPVAQDRTIRALVALVDELTLGRDEEGLIQATLEHVVSSLSLTGGTTYLPASDGGLVPAAHAHLPSADREASLALARQALDEGRPLVQEIPPAGWIAAAPLLIRQRRLGVLSLHDTGGPQPPRRTRSCSRPSASRSARASRTRALYAELRASPARAEVAAPHHRGR